MKIRLSLLFALLYFCVFSQYNDDDNSFRKSEKSTTVKEERGNGVDPGDPGNTIPIDGHLPILFLIGVVGVVYVYRKKLHGGVRKS